MAIKEHLHKAEGVLLAVFVILLLPFIFLYLLYKLLATPFDYARYKRSRYQQDFPHRYTWLDVPHRDNEPYTAIKENNLPVSYIKWSDAYELSGYFVYKDILLDFTEPFFLDEDGLYSVWNKYETYISEDGTVDEDEGDVRLTIEETKGRILNDFHQCVPEQVCNRVVFFFSHKNIERFCTEKGSDIFRETDGFIVYEKGGLSQAIKDFTDQN